MESSLSAENIRDSLYSIVGADHELAAKEPARLPKGVFLSIITDQQSTAGPSTAKAKLLGQVRDITAEYRTQGRNLFDMLTKAEYQSAHQLPTRFDEQADVKTQYTSLKNRMADIYANKHPQILANTPLESNTEFEQLEAMEHAVYTHIRNNNGQLKMHGDGRELNSKFLKVIELAARHYLDRGPNRAVSIELSNYKITPSTNGIIAQIAEVPGVKIQNR